MIKRIIDGVAYNTATSALIAQSEYEVDFKRTDADCLGKLYQTRGGAYFVHEQIDTGERDDYGDRVYRDRFEPMTAEEAEQWTLSDQTEVFAKSPFAEPPEAQAEVEPGATVYLRLPASLKARIEEAAEQAKLSVNAWMMKVAEGGLQGTVRIAEERV